MPGLVYPMLRFSPKERVIFEYMDLSFHCAAWIQLVLEVRTELPQKERGANNEEGHRIDRNGRT